MQFFKNPFKKYDLIIYDDLYPHPSSGFKLEEFTYLLKNVANSKGLFTAKQYKSFNINIEDHDLHISAVIKDHPELKNKLTRPSGAVNINTKLFYCLFLNETYKNLHWLEKFRIPFAFTLYPGGGFLTDNEEVNFKLKKLFASKYFRKVIVTQKHTLHYLVDNHLCPGDKIEFIFGVVAPQVSFFSDQRKKKYPLDKNTLDICFCATRYTPLGEDKGYPLFVEFIKKMAGKHKHLRFHVIGGFDENVIDVKSVSPVIKFYGYQQYSKLKEIFGEMDLIMSPNQPDKVSKGAFDGFPLGAVVEAALNGVVVMLTDSLDENEVFADGEELVIIRPDLEDMIAKFEEITENMDRFYGIGKNGKRKFEYIYSNDYQMKPRLQLINSLIK